MNEELAILTIRARLLATAVHAGQFRFDKVTPYITHPEAVAKACKPSDQPVALLHDVIEDSDEPAQMSRQIKEQFPEWVYDAVVAMTKVEGENYEDYIQQVKANPIARRVKIQDIRHNLDGDCSPKRKAKYEKALAILEGESIEDQLRRMTADELKAARDYIDYLLNKDKPKPKWEGGQDLWHTKWFKHVRPVYLEAEDGYAVDVFWDEKKMEWQYWDKYGGGEMYESDLVPYDSDNHRQERA